MMVFPFSRGTSVNAEMRSRISLLFAAPSNSFLAFSFSRKLSSTRFFPAVFAYCRITNVFPVCLAPVIKSALFCVSKKCRILSSIFRFSITSPSPNLLFILLWHSHFYRAIHLSVFPQLFMLILSAFPICIHTFLSAFPGSNDM